MTEPIDEIIARINRRSSRREHTASSEKQQSGLLRRIAGSMTGFFTRHTKVVTRIFAGFIIVIGVMVLMLYLLFAESIQKRQHFPERNVLFRSANVTYVAGSTESRGSPDLDRESIYKVYEGTGESKVGTYLFETTRETRGEVETYNLDNSQKIRTISAVRKPELVQAGISISGGIAFREEIAEIILPDGKSRQKYMLYKFIPDRATHETEMTFTEDETGKRHLESRIVDMRYGPHGWLWGKEFRKGTKLYAYDSTRQDSLIADSIVRDVRVLDDAKSSDAKIRVALIKDILRLDDRMPVLPIYTTFEDGIFDWLPQGSTMYLGRDRIPLLKRWKNRWMLSRGDAMVIRIQNHWDLWPGYYPLLSAIKFGGNKNAVYPFNKYNNGGYTLRDRYGDIARIDIHDFILKYGQDVLYEYFLDLNGNGTIDKAHECIGKVLCSISQDEVVDIEKEIAQGKSKRDITMTLSFSFMAPDADLAKGIQYFYLCGYIESCIPDQIHRGYGKHSYLGYIKQQRCDVMLFRDLNASREINIRNISRVLTQESALVAKYDIVKVLEAAKRKYSNDVARMFGIK